MIKAQVHETFKSFLGNSLAEVGKSMADFVEHYKLAPKSLSVVRNHGQFILTVGYRSNEAGYLVSVESVVLTGLNLANLDETLSKAEASIAGDVICHSIFLNADNTLEVAFLLHV
jgi:hypothetical protein